MITTKFMGLNLSSPIVAGSSAMCANYENIEKLANNGVGAVVLKSIFQEQMALETSHLLEYDSSPEAADYLSEYIKEGDLSKTVKLIKECKQKLDIPIIASVNCISQGQWLEFCTKLEGAGADALELNIFYMPTSQKDSGADIEKRYLDIVAKVVEKVKVPVAVKLSSRFTNHLYMIAQLYNRGVKSVTMFNRFWEPDFDIDKLEVVSQNILSSKGEGRSNLRLISQASSNMPMVEISATTGIDGSESVIKAILAGATVVQVCSLLYNEGADVVSKLNSDLTTWMKSKGYSTLSEFKGKLNGKNIADKTAFDRCQFMKSFGSYK